MGQIVVKGQVKYWISWLVGCMKIKLNISSASSSSLNRNWAVVKAIYHFIFSSQPVISHVYFFKISW